MNKAERIALKIQAEKAAQRHLAYVARLRSDRADQQSQQQRSALRREERLNALREQLTAQRLAEHAPGRKANEGERAVSPLVANQQSPGRRMTERPREERGRPTAELRKLRQQRRVEAGSGPAEERQQPRTGVRAEPQRSQVLRREQVERRGAERENFHELRSSQQRLRQVLAGQRVAEHQQLRAEVETTRQRAYGLREEQSARRIGDRASAQQQQAQRARVRQALGSVKVHEQQDLRAETQASRERLRNLRQQQAATRTADRQVFHEQRHRRAQQRRELGSTRMAEHRNLTTQAQLAKQNVARLRQSEAARRSVSRTRSVSAVLQKTADNMPWLRAADSFVVDENGNAVSLRGINVEGLDMVAPATGQSVAEALSLDDANLSVISDFWGVNLIRLPFQAQTMLSGNGSLGNNGLLTGVDDLVSTLAEANIYTLLSLQAPATDVGTTALPDASVFDCWTILAQHFQDEPAVLFEIFAVAQPGAGDWLSNAQRLIGTIRVQHPAALLFVGNGSGGVDTTGLPLLFTTGDPTPNLVYTIRVAPQQELSVSEENSLSALAKSFPVFASDWAASASFEFDRSAELAANLFSREGIGWAAGTWNANPRLVRNSTAHDFVATRWGNAVQRAMTLPAKEPLTKFLPTEKEML